MDEVVGVRYRDGNIVIISVITVTGTGSETLLQIPQIVIVGVVMFVVLQIGRGIGIGSSRGDGMTDNITYRRRVGIGSDRGDRGSAYVLRAGRSQSP
jgi:hypothetical protein